jgi:DUF1680 family protein
MIRRLKITSSRHRFLLIPSILVACVTSAQSPSLYFQPVGFDQVKIEDDFWKPRMDKVATVTIPVCMDYTELKTPRIRNFEIAAGTRKGKFEGIFYDDSDVYKALEAIAYSIRIHPDTALERRADAWIEKIAAAQLKDGYINTYFTLNGLDKRWTDMSMHEDYNGGHLIEAAIAYYQATGKRKLLEVAIRFANHFDSLFGPGKRHWVTGHEELELALIKLYKITGESRYLHLAGWLLEERGHGYAHGYTWTDWKDTAYAQDKTPIRDTRKITGHAVRAMYLYTGAADYAAQSGDSGYLHAMEVVWDDLVNRKMYLTGGIGSSGENEGFSTDYDLPNEQAYCETCASVGMVFWNHRMNMLTGDSRYLDVLERSLYNAALDGLSLSGDLFFYGNPLASTGRYKRKEWFGTACCPANIARLVASVGNYIYGKSDQGIWINLFIGSETSVRTGQATLHLEQESRYPWEGKINIRVSADRKTRTALHIRIPGWAGGQAVPGDLYYFLSRPEKFRLTIDGKEIPFRMEKGYVVIEREWHKPETITLDLPMDIQMVRAADKVAADAGRVAVQRGPLVYCFEGKDNDGKAWNLLLPLNTRFNTRYEPGLLGGIVTVEAMVPAIRIADDGQSVSTEWKKVTGIPYFAWANRGASPMQVWLPWKINDVKIGF